jgi:uncharacterized RDD family membrane protein YckC
VSRSVGMARASHVSRLTRLYRYRMAQRNYTDAFIAPTFGQRLGGRLLDGLLLVPVFALSAILFSGTAFDLVVVALAAVYDIGGVATWGRTLEKRIVGTRVVSISSESLRPWQAVVRFAVYAVPIFVCSAVGSRIGTEAWALIVLLPVLRPPLHRGLHDLAARTIVIPTTT